MYTLVEKKTTQNLTHVPNGFKKLVKCWKKLTFSKKSTLKSANFPNFSKI